VEGINDAGQVVGVATFRTRPFDAYLWKNGRATDLGAVDGDGCSWAHAKNSLGQVVGQSFACDGSTGTTFLLENGSMVDLNSLIPPNSKLQLVDAQAINDRGEIAGLGFPPGCTQDTQCGHAYVLIPCDDGHADEGDCKEGDQAATATASQNNPAPVTQNSTNMRQNGLTAEMLAGLRSRLPRRYRSLGIWPRE
jgi:probable HAF family extracellular repeat protein